MQFCAIDFHISSREGHNPDHSNSAHLHAKREACVRKQHNSYQKPFTGSDGKLVSRCVYTDPKRRRMATIKQLEMFSPALFRPGEKNTHTFQIRRNNYLGSLNPHPFLREITFAFFFRRLGVNKASALVGLDLIEPTKNIQLLAITCKI